MIQSVDWSGPKLVPSFRTWTIDILEKKCFRKKSYFREGPGRISPYWINNHLLWPVFRVGGPRFFPKHLDPHVTPPRLWQTCFESPSGWHAMVPTMRQVRLIKAYMYIHTCLYKYTYIHAHLKKRNILFTLIYKNIFILNHSNISISDIRIL